MAEYAAAIGCVRVAAGGFSPGPAACMPARKTRCGLHIDFMLEIRSRFFPAAYGSAAGESGSSKGQNTSVSLENSAD